MRRSKMLTAGMTLVTLAARCSSNSTDRLCDRCRQSVSSTRSGRRCGCRSSGLIPVMLGVIQEKAFVWKTGFWGKHGTDGWHHDLMLVMMNLVIVCTDGGRFGLFRVTG